MVYFYQKLIAVWREVHMYIFFSFFYAQKSMDITYIPILCVFSYVWNVHKPDQLVALYIVVKSLLCPISINR